MKKISILLSIILLLSLFLVAFSGCDNDDGSSSSSSDGKQVPVYQGMSISSAVGTVSSGRQFANCMAYNGKEDFDYDKDNGKHNGHFKGDYDGNDQEVDQENPFPENDPDETIEEETKSTLEVIGSADTIYYATPNQDIYINIHLSNPDSFEIMSFTLNGKKYSSYMFEDGSNMEKIVLKYNVGESVGIVEYTIDAIKYIDGTEIKDVIIDGNKTVKAGIKTDDQLVAEFTTPNIGTNSISFFSTINDKRDLIAHSNGIIKAVIYDGEAIVAEKTLSAEKTEVVFDNLKTNSLYQYAIVAYYDDLSGIGEAMHVLYKSAFYTRPVVLFDNITVGKEGIEFDFKWNELYEGEEIKSLTLYYGQEQADIKVGEGISGSITGLLSGKTYTIYAEYDNKGNAEQIYLEFTTGAKIEPMLEFAMSDDGLGFLVIFTDSDEVITSKKVELIRGDTVQELEVLEEYDITALLSNTEYTYKVTYIYDLNDGEGEHTVVREITVPTLTKVAPTLEITSAEITYTSVKFAVSLTDNDSVIKSTKTELVHGNSATLLENLPVYEFTDLLSNNEYTLRVTYVYDLGDGEGEHTEVKELSVTTLAKTVPYVDIKNTGKTKTSLKFTVSVTDTDNVIKSRKTTLMIGDNDLAAELENLDEYEITDLLSGNRYMLLVTYVYDLNDGEGEREGVKVFGTGTLAMVEPGVNVTSMQRTTTSLKFGLKITDNDGVIKSRKTELVHLTESGETAMELENLNDYEITNLLSDNDYIIRVTFVCDFNDGVGERTEVKEFTARTNSKIVPTVGISVIGKTYDSLSFSVSMNDRDGTIISRRAEFVNLVNQEDVIYLENNNRYTLRGLFSNTEYVLRIYYTYDLNDGKGEQEGVIEKVERTTEKQAPTFLEGAVIEEGANCISFPLNKNDPHRTLISYKVELFFENELIKTINNPTNRVSFDGLEYNSLYEIRITYTYDPGDGSGLKTQTTSVTATTKHGLEIVECKVVNTTGVSEGETIYLELKLDNPSGLTVSTVKVNGRTYSVLPASTENKVFVEIVNNGQYEGGATKLNIQAMGFEASNENAPTSQTFENVSGSVFINGKLSVLSVEFVDSNFNPIEDDWVGLNSGLYVLVTFKNPTGYEIDEINGKQYTKLDDNRYYISKDGSYGWKTLGSITSVKYHNEYISKTLSLTGNTTDRAIFVTASNEIVPIYSAEDLLNMDKGYHYSLMQDIDLSGIEWVGKNFYGVFDGNGYSIIGLSYVASSIVGDKKFGLFDYAIGVVNDLHFEEVTIIASFEQEDYVYCGALAARCGSLIVDNCTVDKYSVINIENEGGVTVGGLVGTSQNSSNFLEFKNCSSAAKIVISCETLTSYSSGKSAGGIFGSGSGRKVTFINCENSGDISATSSWRTLVGGLAGIVQGVNTSFINCKNSGDLSAFKTSSSMSTQSSNVGGIVGAASTSSCKMTFTSCTNSGDLSGVGRMYSYVGGMVGDSEDGATFNSCANTGAISCSASNGYSGQLKGA